MPDANTFQMATRLGFAARGLLYATIGFLALYSGRTENPGDTLAYLASGTGRLIVAAMAVGFFGYGVWRLIESWVDSEGRGDDGKGIAIRLAGAVSGLVHFGLGVAAALLAAGEKGGGGDASQTGAATALDWPGGGVLLYAIAAALIATGLFQLRKGWTLSFLRHLEPRAARQGWVAWLGRLGHLARGLVFLLIGWFLFDAARTDSASAAGGIGEALSALPATPQMAVAGGLFLFGLFSLVEARYRHLANPHAFGGAS